MLSGCGLNYKLLYIGSCVLKLTSNSLTKLYKNFALCPFLFRLYFVSSMNQKSKNVGLKKDNIRIKSSLYDDIIQCNINVHEIQVEQVIEFVYLVLRACSKN